MPDAPTESPGSESNAAEQLAARLREAEAPAKLELRGARLAGTDLSGLDLSGADLSEADLAGARLAEAVLRGAKLRGADLRGATLDASELLGADLREARLWECRAQGAGFGGADLGGAQLMSAVLANATLSHARLEGADLRVADLSGVRLHEADLGGADLAGAKLAGAELVQTRVAGANFRDADLRGARLAHLVGFDDAEWLGVDIRDGDFRGGLQVRRLILDENFLYEFRTRSRTHHWIYSLWRITSDCGRSFGRWALFSLAIILFFAVCYGFVAIDFGDHPTPLSPLYFSVVTLTTLGYGDAVPASMAAQCVAMLQVVTGYFALGGLLSIFANKMARRAD